MALFSHLGNAIIDFSSNLVDPIDHRLLIVHRISAVDLLFFLKILTGFFFICFQGKGELELDLVRWRPALRIFRVLKLYRVFSFYYVVESRTVYPNAWRVANLVSSTIFSSFFFLFVAIFASCCVGR